MGRIVIVTYYPFEQFEKVIDPPRGRPVGGGGTYRKRIESLKKRA
jgi:hypothetical protein